MLDEIALPFICAAKPYSFAKWFACLGEIISHPLLHEEERVLGLWLAIQSTKNESFTCSFNYEQIASAVNKSSRKIYRILTRLRLMGFLIADIPIYYGEPTPEMVQEIRILKLGLSPKPLFSKENENVVVLPYKGNRPKITLNIINRSEPIEKNEEVKKKHLSFIPLSFVRKILGFYSEALRRATSFYKGSKWRFAPRYKITARGYPLTMHRIRTFPKDRHLTTSGFF